MVQTLFGLQDAQDRKRSGEFWTFGCTCTCTCTMLLFNRYLTKWRSAIFHDIYLSSLLASAWLGRTYTMNMKSGLRVTTLCWLCCNSHAQNQVLNGGLFVRMWRWILLHMYLFIFHILYMPMLPYALPIGHGYISSYVLHHPMQQTFLSPDLPMLRKYVCNIEKSTHPILRTSSFTVLAWDIILLIRYLSIDRYIFRICTTWGKDGG